jgi:hypothetical protein
MPTDYDLKETWDKVYDKTRPKIEPWISDWEWRQADDSWGEFATRKTNPATKRSKWIFGYSRAWAFNHAGHNDQMDWHIQVRDGLLALFPSIATTDRIFFIGGGFGFHNEVWKDLGYVNSWTIEPSSYIQGNKATETAGDIILVNENLRSGNAFLNALRNATGERTADWIIDCEILLGYSNDEIETVVANPSTRFIDLFEHVLTGTDQTRIIHLVRQGTSNIPEVIRRPMAEWEAFDPAHSWIDVEVL